MENNVKPINVRVKIVGSAPLLMNSPKGMIKEEGKKGATKSVYDAKEDCEKALYKDEKGRICIPSEAIMGCIRESGKNFLAAGKGKKTLKTFIMGGVMVSPDMIPLISKKEYEIDTRRAVIRGNGIMKSRPRFDEWGCEFELCIIDLSNLDAPTIQTVLEYGGKFQGLLDFRPRFGRFEVEKYEVIK